MSHQLLYYNYAVLIYYCTIDAWYVKGTAMIIIYL